MRTTCWYTKIRQWSIFPDAPGLLLKPGPLPRGAAPPLWEGRWQKRGGRGLRTGRAESVGSSPVEAVQAPVSHPGTWLVTELQGDRRLPT